VLHYCPLMLQYHGALPEIFFDLHSGNISKMTMCQAMGMVPVAKYDRHLGLARGFEAPVIPQGNQDV